MKNSTFTLTIVVMTPMGTQHYLLVKQSATMQELTDYQILIDNFDWEHRVIKKGKNGTLFIFEPMITAQEIADINLQYFPTLGIIQQHLMKDAFQPGNGIFWTLFDEDGVSFVKYLFSSKSIKEIADVYITGEKSIESKVTEYLKIIKIKYPNEKINNRKQLRKFGIKKGVYVVQKCNECGRVL